MHKQSKNKQALEQTRLSEQLGQRKITLVMVISIENK